MPTVGRPSGRWSIVGRKRSKKPARPIASCANVWPSLGLEFEEIYTEYFGVNAVLGPAAPKVSDPPEVQLRIGVRGQDRKAVDRFTREMIPLVLSGPPGGTGYGEGRPKVREVRVVLGCAGAAGRDSNPCRGGVVRCAVGDSAYPIG